ncbi:MAG: MFS transporter, partial [Thermoguttaceae bacterium]|nr:MFS transporter [Thermoguttaceae bacterium]
MAEGKGGVAMYIRLQIAYALEFAIWGCWSYALGAYCNFNGIAQGSLFAAFAFGALFAPIVGPIADKKFAAQKVLAFMQLICGISLFACFRISHQVAASGASDPGMVWWALMFVAGLMFMPTIPLLNAIVFKHIPNDKKAPFVFIFGTIGWIVVNWVLADLGLDKQGEFGVENFYLIDGAIAVAFAIYALTLPSTPPSGSSNGDPLGLKALGLFKRADFAIFIICATLVGIFGSNFYFPFFGDFFYGSKGVFNQYSELIFMAALAFAVAKIGLKWTLTLGLGAWGVRYLLFAQVNDGCVLVGILCHGLAYAFLYTAAYMYGDKVAPKEMKASVQALIAFLLLGVAQILSGYAVNWEKNKHNLGVEAPAPVTASFLTTTPAFAQDDDINNVAEAVADAVAEKTDAAVEATQDVVEAVADVAQDAAAATADAVDATFDAAADVAQDAGEAISNAADATVDAVADTVDAAADMAQDAGEAISDAADATVGAVSDAFDSAVDAVADAAEAVSDAAAEAATP